MSVLAMSLSLAWGMSQPMEDACQDLVHSQGRAAPSLGTKRPKPKWGSIRLLPFFPLAAQGYRKQEILDSKVKVKSTRPRTLNTRKLRSTKSHTPATIPPAWSQAHVFRDGIWKQSSAPGSPPMVLTQLCPSLFLADALTVF